jgi:hypothetical protein
MKMNAKKTTILVVILAALAGVISFVIWFSNRGFSAREKPSWIETVMARHARKIATPAGAKELKNPQQVTEASAAEAREIEQQFGAVVRRSVHENEIEQKTRVSGFRRVALAGWRRTLGVPA